MGGTVVTADKVQAQVEPGAGAGASGDVAVVDVKAVGLDPDRGELPL
jgi:hypothetical protein